MFVAKFKVPRFLYIETVLFDTPFFSQVFLQRYFQFHSNLDPDLEIVTTSGYGKNGALSVIQVLWNDENN